MKRVYSNSELPHIFAKQSQDEGWTSNKSMYFEGNKIYSYGSHHCIAQILEDGKSVLFNSSTYSVTTSNHHSQVRSALSHLDGYTVPYPIQVFEGGNSEYCIEGFKSSLDSYHKAIKWKETHLDGMQGCIETLEFLIGYESNSKESRFFDELNSMKKTMKDMKPLHEQFLAQQEEKERIAEIKFLEKSKEDIIKWKRGDLNSLSYKIKPAFLRLSLDDKETVETSQGVTIPLKDSITLWNMIKAGKDVQGHEIDGYTVISLNGTLKIGCHDISREEVDRFGAILDTMEVK